MVSIGDVNLLLVIYRQEQDAVNSDLDRDNRCFIVIVHHSSWVIGNKEHYIMDNADL